MREKRSVTTKGILLTESLDGDLETRDEDCAGVDVSSYSSV
jgi:hypothetical protein